MTDGQYPRQPQDVPQQPPPSYPQPGSQQPGSGYPQQPLGNPPSQPLAPGDQSLPPSGPYPPQSLGYPAAGPGYPPQGSPPQQPGYPPPGYSSQPSPNPGSGLGIAGLIVGLLTGPLAFVGLILSILGLRKSKKVGMKNGVALAGIIVSSVIFVASVALIVTTLLGFASILSGTGSWMEEQCAKLGPGSHKVGSITVMCGQSPVITKLTPMQEPTLEQSPTTSTISCPAEVTNFPAEEVDPEACGPIPSDAVPLSQVVGDNYPLLLTEDGNISCELGGADGDDSAYAFCQAFEVNYGNETIAVKVDEHSQVVSAADSGESEPFTLETGQGVYIDDIVCRAQTDAMVCWNSKTGHGFLLSRDWAIGW